MNPNIGLADKNRVAVVKLLQALLADAVVLETRTRNAHWNITGPHFHHLHEMFGAQYDALGETVDELAERIRHLGGRPAGTLTEFLHAARLKETPGEFPNAAGWLRALLHGHEAAIRQLRADVETSGKLGDAGTNDFLVGLMEAHEKTAWMLRASLEA